MVLGVTYIPDEVVEEVRLRSDIVDVISRYVNLRKKGRYYIGLCPFHQERTPSFTVTPDKQIFYCFGCHAGGDVFKFLMLKERLAFDEAVRLLAQQAGVAVPLAQEKLQQGTEKKNAHLYKIIALARDFFCESLLTHRAAEPARKYLEKRGLPAEIIERFQLGYALPGRSSLLVHLSSKGFRAEDVVRAGLAVVGDGGKYYDRFSQRIIFPIWDPAGRVVGFSGRVLDGSQPKYINTPETPFFYKGNLLYGLHLARAAIKEKGFAVIVEGYMDVIAAHQYGLCNTVASMGTSLTSEQVKLLKHYTKNVYVAYDADAAGVAAACRGMDLLQEMGCRVRVVTVPEGKDPDEFLRKKGAAGMEELLDGAPDLIEYKLKKAAGAMPLVSTEAKIEAMRWVLPNLYHMNGGVEREEALKKVARFLDLSWEAVTSELKRYKLERGKKWLNPDNIVKNKHNTTVKRENTGAVDARSRAEAGVLRAVLEDPALAGRLLEEFGKAPFKNPVYGKIFSLYVERSGQLNGPAELLKYLPEEGQAALSKLLTHELPDGSPKDIMEQYIQSMKRCDRQVRRRELIRAIREAEEKGHKALYDVLCREYIILRSIEEAEKTGDAGRLGALLEEYRCFLQGGNGENPEEGSESE